MSANEPIEATGTEPNMGTAEVPVRPTNDRTGAGAAPREGAGGDGEPVASGERGRGRPRGPQGIDRSGRALREMEGPDARVAALVRALSRRISERPLTALVAAIGVGFVVGGALSFRAGRIALAAAGRHVVQQVLKQVL